jgi:hypothetical protein
MGGYEIAFGIASGTIGRSGRGNGKTLLGLEFPIMTLLGGAGADWEDGLSLKALF